MPNVQLTWSQATWVGIALVLLAVGLGRSASGRARWLAPFAREAGVIALLYALWQLAGTLAEHGTAGGLARGRWIARTQDAWYLPSERTLQGPLIDHAWLGWSANIYYAVMHFTGLLVLLFWVFWRHRERYARLRTLVIGFTGLALLVQLIPVAPPRLLPELGFTDIAARYGQSVYGLGAFSADELSALPSVHVGWAVIVGLYPVLISTSPWRWLALAHPVITVYVVAATANHWWFDGLAAILLLGVVAGAQVAWTSWRTRAVGEAASPPAVDAMVRPGQCASAS